MAQNTDLEPSVCPQCSGRGQQNVVYRTATGDRALQPVQCGLCDGRGFLPVNDVIALPARPTPPDPNPASPLPVDLWLIAVPLGLFILFFLFLWL
jgi:hypothetical protein